jgi:hypothetical protein
MSRVVFVRLEGGSLDRTHHLLELSEDEWPMPEHAWFVRDGVSPNVIVVAAEPGKARPKALRNIKIDRYRRVSTSGDARPKGRVSTCGAVYRYDPER